jgi:hypothetical protein
MNRRLTVLLSLAVLPEYEVLPEAGWLTAPEGFSEDADSGGSCSWIVDPEKTTHTTYRRDAHRYLQGRHSTGAEIADIRQPVRLG